MNRPMPRRRRCIVLGCAVAVMLSLSPSAIRPARTAAATPVASPAATPAAAITLGDVDPAGLRDDLLTSPPPADMLPDGPEPIQVYPWDDMNDDDLVGTLGGAIIATEDPFGSGLSPAISYIVFADETAATGRYASIAAIEVEEGVTVTPLTPGQSGGLPATIIAYEDQTLCVVQLDYVLVIASVAPTDDADADGDAVVGYANAGIDHLLGLAEEVG